MSQRSHVLPRILGASAVTLVGGTVLTTGQPAQALSYTVTNTNASGVGSLSQALLDAKNNTGPDTITFDPSVTGTISLSLASAYVSNNPDSGYLPVINDDLTITGPGSDDLTIDGMSYICDIFSNVRYDPADGGSYVVYDVNVTISGLTITNARCDAIDIYQDSDGGSTLTGFDLVVTNSQSSAVEFTGRSLSLTDVAFSMNDGDGVLAYMFESDSTVTITDSTITDNGADGVDTRGPESGGSVTITDSTISNNDDNGAYINYVGTVSVTGSTLSDNGNDGLDIYDADSATVATVTATGNGHSAVKLSNVSKATVSSLTATGNGSSPDYYSGLDAGYVGTLTITDSTFNENFENGIDLYAVDTATLTNVTANDNQYDGLEFDSEATWSTSISITDSTFSGNADSGINGDDVEILALTNVTASDNKAYGLYVEGIGSVTVTGSTFDDNGYEGYGDGIKFSYADSATITSTQANGNYDDGIDLYMVQAVTITDVTANDNYDDGLEFDAYDDWSDTVSITNSTFNGNEDSGINGDDVEILTLTNVTANDNDDYGVYVEGIDSVTVTDSTFTGNDKGLKFDDVYVSVEITDVTSSANFDDGVNLNDMRGQSVAVTRLTANDNEGHGLEVDDSDASVEITDVTASGNYQAGVKIEDIKSGTVTVTRLTADDNLYGVYIERTDPEAETMIVDSSFDGNDEGVRVRLASADLERITISNSYADGIIGLGASITVTNSTVTSSGRDGIWLEGDSRYIGREQSPPYAPIYESVASDVTVSHSTITGNTGSGIAASGTFTQYVWFYNGPGDYGVNAYDINSAQDITVDNTIVSGNGDVDVYNGSENNAGDDQGTTTVTWSLVDEGSAHTGTGNVEADDPKLGALADNGGETLTMLPADDSPAISAGNPSTTGAPATDQRGVNRIVNRLEIGAVEVDADQGTITVLPPSAAGETTGITVPVTRSGAAEGPSSITLRSCDGVVRTLSWADGETGTKTATFPLTDNATDDPDRICTIEIVSRTGADPGIVASWPVTVTDLEDSPAELPATGSSGALAWMAAAVLGIGTAMSRTGRRRTN